MVGPNNEIQGRRYGEGYNGEMNQREYGWGGGVCLRCGG